MPQQEGTESKAAWAVVGGSATTAVTRSGLPDFFRILRFLGVSIYFARKYVGPDTVQDMRPWLLY